MPNSTVPDLAVFGIRIGLLVLLWGFVLAAVRVMRNDLNGAGATGRPVDGRTRPTQRKPAKPAKPPRPPTGRGVPRRLVVTAGGLTGTSMSLGDQPITIGRADDSTLVLTDDYASARHARLLPHEGQWLVEDLGSTNGTYLDRDKVIRATIVPPGAAIRIGKTAIELRR